MKILYPVRSENKNLPWKMAEKEWNKLWILLHSWCFNRPAEVWSKITFHFILQCTAVKPGCQHTEAFVLEWEAEVSALEMCLFLACVKHSEGSVVVHKIFITGLVLERFDLQLSCQCLLSEHCLWCGVQIHHPIWSGRSLNRHLI